MRDRVLGLLPTGVLSLAAVAVSPNHLSVLFWLVIAAVGAWALSRLWGRVGGSGERTYVNGHKPGLGNWFEKLITLGVVAITAAFGALIVIAAWPLLLAALAIYGAWWLVLRPFCDTTRREVQ